MAYRDELWSVMHGVHKQILEHPFVTGLTDGSLSRDAFRYYVIQDAHYLRDYARALAVCAAKAPAEDDVAMFAEHAHGALVVEKSLHAGFLAEFGVPGDVAAAAPMSPTTTAYTSYLLGAVYGGSFAEAVGAVLPCYWIYAEVGRALLARSSPDPLYARWIATYGGEEFQAIVAAVLDLVDRLGAGLSGVEHDRVARHVLTTARYEWMFWDAAWRQETWPV